MARFPFDTSASDSLALSFGSTFCSVFGSECRGEDEEGGELDPELELELELDEELELEPELDELETELDEGEGELVLDGPDFSLLVPLDKISLIFSNG